MTRPVSFFRKVTIVLELYRRKWQGGNIYIDFIYRINHLYFIDSSTDMAISPVSTKRIDKFIDFLSIIHRFRFETIYLQEFEPD